VRAAAALVSLAVAGCGTTIVTSENEGGGGNAGSTAEVSGSGGPASTSASASVTSGGTGVCAGACPDLFEAVLSQACLDCGSAATFDAAQCAAEGGACLDAVANDTTDPQGCCPCGSYRQARCTADGFFEALCPSHQPIDDALAACICRVCG
jgi:hypothetical protein